MAMKQKNSPVKKPTSVTGLGFKAEIERLKKEAAKKNASLAAAVNSAMNNMAKLKFDDVSINQFTVLSYLDDQFFSDSTVTMSNDDYLKKTIRNRILQVTFFTEGVISLNKDADTLNRAMLRASLSDVDLDTILNTSLNISSVQLQVQTKEEQAAGDADKLAEHLEHERRAMGSVESLISIIEDNLGDTRVKYHKLTDEEMQDAVNAGYAVTSLPPQTVSFEKPLVLNFDFLELKKFTPEDIADLLNKTISIDSNAELSFGIKADLFVPKVRAFFTDLEVFLDVAIAHARSAVNNAVVFIPEADPFKQLWNAL